jgi:hypothetical protein
MLWQTANLVLCSKQFATMSASILISAKGNFWLRAAAA